jgi:hypothetical protein
MLVRFFMAIAAGLLVGGILYEGLLSIYSLFFPDHALLESMLDDLSFSVDKALILTCFWAIGASASSLVATGLGESRWAGALAAACWVIPLGLLIGLSQQPAVRLTLALSIAILAGLICLRINGMASGRAAR